MNRIANFLHYRKLRIRNAGTLAGIECVVIPALQGALIAGVVILVYGLVTRTVEASQREADLHVAERLKQQSGYVAALEKTLAKCLSGGDNAIQIGDEIWMCGATNTGVKVRP